MGFADVEPGIADEVAEVVGREEVLAHLDAGAESLGTHPEARLVRCQLTCESHRFAGPVEQIARLPSPMCRVVAGFEKDVARSLCSQLCRGYYHLLALELDLIAAQSSGLLRAEARSQVK